MKLYDNEGFRDEFVEAVYEIMANDLDNCRANQIIAAFDTAPSLEALSVEIPFENLNAMNQRSIYVVNWDDPNQSGWAVLRGETILDEQVLQLKFLDRSKRQVCLTKENYHNPWVPCYREPTPVQNCVFVSGDRYQRLKADFDSLKQELDALKLASALNAETA